MNLNGLFFLTCNFGFGINEHIYFWLKYDLISDIYGMDFFIVISKKEKELPEENIKYQD